MLYALTGLVWVASVLFTNPATGYKEYVRNIPEKYSNKYSNDVISCSRALTDLTTGAYSLKFDVEAAWCAKLDPNLVWEHEVIIPKKEEK